VEALEGRSVEGAFLLRREFLMAKHKKVERKREIERRRKRREKRLKQRAKEQALQRAGKSSA